MRDILRRVLFTLALLTVIQICSTQDDGSGFTEWTEWTNPPCGQCVQTFRTRECTSTPPTCSGSYSEKKETPCTITVSTIDSGVIGGAVGMALMLLLIGGLATCLLRTGSLTLRSSACTDSKDGRHTTDTGDNGEIPAHAHVSGVTGHDYAELNDHTRMRDEMPTYEVLKIKVYDNSQN